MQDETRSVEDIDAEIATLNTQRDALRERAKALTAIRDRKVLAASAAAKLAAITPEERAALQQAREGAA